MWVGSARDTSLDWLMGCSRCDSPWRYSIPRPDASSRSWSAPVAGTDFSAFACCSSILRSKRSFSGWPRFCLQPRYRSVVNTDACPNRNWICASSPPFEWHSFAQVLRRSCGAMCSSPARWQHLRTTYQTTFCSEIPDPQTLPLLATARNTLPFVMPAAEIQSSSDCFAQWGIGTVRMWPPLPIRAWP